MPKIQLIPTLGQINQVDAELRVENGELRNECEVAISVLIGSAASERLSQNGIDFSDFATGYYYGLRVAEITHAQLAREMRIPSIEQIRQARAGFDALEPAQRAAEIAAILEPLHHSGTPEFPCDDRFVEGHNSGYHLAVRAANQRPAERESHAVSRADDLAERIQRQPRPGDPGGPAPLPEDDLQRDLARAEDEGMIAREEERLG